MKSKSILTKFLVVLAPIYLVLVLVGSFMASQVLIRDNTDILAARVGSLAARVSLALDMHEAYAYNTLACLLYTSPSPRDGLLSRMPSSA